MEFKKPYHKLVIKQFFVKKHDNFWWLCGKDENGDNFKIDYYRPSYTKAKEDMAYCRRQYATTQKLAFLEYGTKYRYNENGTLCMSSSGWHSVFEIL